jgi:AcrR family transcriptional regulator
MATGRESDNHDVEMSGGPLRADAARNAAQIRAAALAAFHGRGLSTPLDQVAVAAGVSKATIYNRFGGRQGLIDAVIEELVAAELRAAMAATRAVDDPWERLAGWISARRDLQYREPAFTDVMVGSHAESPMVAELAAQAAAVTDAVVDAAQAGGVMHSETTAGDIFWADVANGLALRVLRKPRRADYDRRTRHFVRGLRPR